MFQPRKTHPDLAKIVDWDIKNQIKKKSILSNRLVKLVSTVEAHKVLF